MIGLSQMIKPEITSHNNPTATIGITI